jgi:hypothetical protein
MLPDLIQGAFLFFKVFLNTILLPDTSGVIRNYLFTSHFD